MTHGQSDGKVVKFAHFKALIDVLGEGLKTLSRGYE